MGVGLSYIWQQWVEFRDRFMRLLDIDAASWWSKLKNINWPLLKKPTTLYMLITGVIGSFQVFEATYVMTQGGP